MNISTFFMKICNMSLTATYCIAAIILLRLLLKRQPKVFSYLLWCVVLFRLLCPVSVSGNYSLLWMDTNLISEENLSGYRGARIVALLSRDSVMSDDIPEMSGDGINDIRAMTAGSGFYGREAVRLLQKIFTVGGWIWICGIIVLMAYSLGTTLRFRKFLQGASRTKDDVFEMEGLTTPFVFGIIRPRIYLSAHLQDQERRFVLEHEHVHIVRKDYLIKILAWGTVCLHWFNPAVWLAYKLMGKDMEMSCDEAVVRKLGYDVRKEYSQALLSLSCDKMKLGGCPIAFGEGAVKNRVQNILTYHKKTGVAIALMVILICAAIVGLFMNPVRASDAGTGEMFQFVKKYADAFCDRDGDTLLGLYIDEDIAFKNVIGLDHTGEGYTFGFSSPWPHEYRFLIDVEEGHQDEGTAEIRYYAWTSDPHVTVWKEKIEFSMTPDGYRVTDSEMKWLNSISTAEEFIEAYLFLDEYWFTDYTENGALEAINAQTQYDMEAGAGTDRNFMYRSPETAAEWLFNLSGGVSEIESTNSSGQATVRYTFADGSDVLIPMCDANFDGMTANGSDEDLEDASFTNTQVWLPDLKVWNAKAP